VSRADRPERLARRAADRGLDLLLVTDPVDVRWLTGFSGSAGLAVVGGDRRSFITDFRYVTQAAEQVPGFDRRTCERELFDALGVVVAAGATVGFDDADITVKQRRRLAEVLPGAEFVAAGGLVKDLRAVKDADELQAMRAAAALADAAFEATIDRGLVGRTERAVALDLEQEMRVRGAQRPSFDSIVAAGPHGALPHAEPRGAVIGADTLVVIDWGAQLDGYCSDCTRTVATGSIPDPAREIYDLVLAAQVASLAAVAPGAACRDVDAVARDRITAAGHGEHFGHGLGHGVGMEVHEEPRLSRASEATLVAGNVVTVEPGVYLPGEFGVRIEDLAAVTADGLDRLNGLPKELRVVT